jgi:hypothetical protein
VGRDYREGDTQPKPHPILLRREKGLEDASHFFGRNATTPVNYEYAHLFSFRQVGAHEKPTPNRLDIGHRVTSIANEVE